MDLSAITSLVESITGPTLPELNPLTDNNAKEQHSLNLFDENSRAVSICNMTDNNGRHYFIQDKSSYKKNLKARDASRNIALISAALLFVFLCIFTLNFGSSGWTVGNLLTFGIVVGTFLMTLQFGKQWNENNMLISTINNYGIPCVTAENGRQMVHCSR